MGTNIGIGNYIGKSKPQGSSFHPSLVDYWNFAGKKNSDTDRAIIKGIKGNILNAYNFGWSLNSGYGLYKENYNNYKNFNGTRANISYTDSSILVTEIFLNAKFIEVQGRSSANNRINASGITDDIDLYYGTSSVYVKLVNGINDLPSFENYAGFYTKTFLGKCNITIQQIPEYEGAIVTDGIDDYLKLDKVGYKVGTIIMKFKSINIKPNIVNSILNIHTDEVALQYNTSGVLISNFTTYKNYGEYSVGTFNVDRNAATPLTLGCKLSNSGNPMEYSNVAIYSVAIYQDVLTEEQVLAEIDKMNKL